MPPVFQTYFLYFRVPHNTLYLPTAPTLNLCPSPGFTPPSLSLRPHTRAPKFPLPLPLSTPATQAIRP